MILRNDFSPAPIGGHSPPRPRPAAAAHQQAELLDGVQLSQADSKHYLQNELGERLSLPEQGRFQLGRSSEAQVRLQGDLVSRHHAQAEFRNGQLWIQDTSSNGTFVNGEQLQPNKWVEVPRGARLGFGQAASTLQLGSSEQIQPGPHDLTGPQGQVFHWPEGASIVTVGRGEDNHFHLPHSNVSGKHAMLRRHEGKLQVLDNSRNGTFIGEQRVEPMRWTEVPPGSALTFGDPEVTWNTSAP